MSDIASNNVPLHVAVIPDGNRRWARAHGLKPWEGHEEGAKNIEELVKKALDLGVRYFSFWGSSVDNLTKRPMEEKRALLGIYERYFQKLIDSEDIAKNETHINIIGRWREQFPKSLRRILEEGIEKGFEKGVVTGIEKGMSQGIEKGISKGIEKGEQRKTYEFARNLLLNTDFSVSKIAALTNCPESFVDTVRQEIL